MTIGIWLQCFILLDSSSILKLNFLHVVIVHGYEEEWHLFQMYMLKYLGVKCHDTYN